MNNIFHLTAYGDKLLPPDNWGYVHITVTHLSVFPCWVTWNCSADSVAISSSLGKWIGQSPLSLLLASSSIFAKFGLTAARFFLSFSSTTSRRMFIRNDCSRALSTKWLPTHDCPRPGAVWEKLIVSVVWDNHLKQFIEKQVTQPVSA